MLYIRRSTRILLNNAKRNTCTLYKKPVFPVSLGLTEIKKKFWILDKSRANLATPAPLRENECPPFC